MKKSGFTLIEMIIVLAVTVIIIGIASSMFTNGNRIFSDSDAKSTLQIQAHAIEEELSKTGMEAVRITSIKDALGNDYINNDINDKIANQSYKNLKLTDINGGDSEKKWLEISELTVDYYYYEEINGIGVVSTTPASVIIYEKHKEKLSTKDEKVFQGRIQSVRIKPIDIENTNGTFRNTNSIAISITLVSESGFAKVTYPVLITVKFRNNFMR